MWASMGCYGVVVYIIGANIEPSTRVSFWVLQVPCSKRSEASLMESVYSRRTGRSDAHRGRLSGGFHGVVWSKLASSSNKTYIKSVSRTHMVTHHPL